MSTKTVWPPGTATFCIEQGIRERGCSGGIRRRLGFKTYKSCSGVVHIDFCHSLTGSWAFHIALGTGGFPNIEMLIRCHYWLIVNGLVTTVDSGKSKGATQVLSSVELCTG